MRRDQCRARYAPAGWLLAFLLLAAPVLWSQPYADYKIDRGLMAVLADDADATAAFYVILGERAPLKPAYRIANRAARGRYVVQALQATADRSQAGVRAFLQGRQVSFVPFWIGNKIYVVSGTLELARALARMPEVVAIIPAVVYTIPQPVAGGVASTQAVEWNIVRINADDVWPTTRGEGSVVANIDTGVQYSHPALVNQYRGKVGAAFVHTGNWRDPTGLCGSAPCDNMGHGTHTMGTMVGGDGGANQIGVAPGAKWMACKGCITNSCYDVHLNFCAQWILDPNGDGSGSGQPDVVNNSWGGGKGNPWFQSNVQAWRAAGIFPAFSAGNSGPNCGTAGSPGDYPESFAAGATSSDTSDTIAGFSARGPSAFGPIKPDAAAPGVIIRSSVPTNSYANYSGTSMAGPHVAGAVALMWAAAPGQRGNVPDAVQRLKDTAAIRSTAETCGGLPPGAVPNNTYGSGRIDALAAVNGGGGGGNQPPTVTITAPASGASFPCPATVNFLGTASDPEDIDRSAFIIWSEAGTDFASGPEASKDYTCAQAGLRTVTARVTDTGGLMDTDTVNFTIVDSGIPAAPSNLSASLSSDRSTVILTWTDNSFVELGFRVERKPKKGVWALLSTTPANVTTYTDVPPGSDNWEYRVRAYNAAGQSDPSNVVQVRTR